MFNITRKRVEWGGRPLTIESGKIARQASGAVVVDYGGTSVLSTVVAQKSKDPVDFLPMTVQFLAKSYAVGKIPGGFFKREGKPSDRETLISRLVDRSIRPLFPAGFCDEIAIVCNLLSYNPGSPPEAVALIGAVSALAISGVPFQGPVAGAKVGYSKEEQRYLLNPSADGTSESALDAFCSGTRESIIMVESEACELSEEEMLGAIAFAHENCAPVLDLIEKFTGSVASKNSVDFVPYNIEDMVSSIGNEHTERFVHAYSDTNKKDRVRKLEVAREELFSQLRSQYLGEGSTRTEQEIIFAVKTFERSLVRTKVLDTSQRIDGRSLEDIRQIEVEVNFIPGTHGSALFTRGDTQALVITALGTPQDEQIVDGFDGDKRERFLLHYNFPPYAVGEAAALRPPGRREIGHGKLAWRAIHPVLPSKADFPYTIRVVSEITESDGSSSMATVCGASLALMDTGVPVRSAVAGIAMGLIKEGEKFAILSDILGDEDYLGDMDFKVAGTREGITALQMDMKIQGIGFDIIEASLKQAKAGRMFIMDKMDSVIKHPRSSVRDHVPRMESMIIDKNKIKNVIGTGGKNVREICDKTGVKIEISQDGTVMIYAVNCDAVEEAKNMIMGIVSEPELGKVFSGVVSEIAKYGAFVTFLGSRRGLVHISEIRNEHITSVSDVLSVNDKVKVLIVDIDRDHIQLSMKRVDQESGDLIECEPYTQRRGGAGAGGGSSFRDYGNSKERRRSDGGERPPRRRSSSVPGGGYREGDPGDSQEFSGGGNSRHDGADTRHSRGGGGPRKPRFF